MKHYYQLQMKSESINEIESRTKSVNLLVLLSIAI